MGLENIFRRIADSARPDGGFDGALQTATALVAPLYGAGAIINRLLHDTGLAQRRALPVITLSVGNITLGGTGKTPFVIWLADWLRAQGRRPVILTRGYGRRDESRLTIVHDGKRLKARAHEAGDEPVLLARQLRNVPIIACSDRHAAGEVAISRFKADTLILDDGFQHHDLARDGDIVLVDATRRLSALRLFPRGTLRERPRVLRRAHLVVLTRYEQAEDRKAVFVETRGHAGSTPVCRVRFAPAGLVGLDGQKVEEESSLRGARAVVVCAVGNPESVRATAREAGLDVADLIALQDHARINRDDWKRIGASLRKHSARYVILTEKDAVKLAPPPALARRILILRVALRFITAKDEQVALKAIRARLEARRVRGLLSN